MNSKAYDSNGVVHMTPHKGAMQSSCSTPDETTEPTFVSPMFLSKETPLTCLRCQMIEAEAEAARGAPDDATAE